MSDRGDHAVSGMASRTGAFRLQLLGSLRMVSCVVVVIGSLFALGFPGEAIAALPIGWSGPAATGLQPRRSHCSEQATLFAGCSPRADPAEQAFARSLRA